MVYNSLGTVTDSTPFLQDHVSKSEQESSDGLGTRARASIGDQQAHTDRHAAALYGRHASLVIPRRVSRARASAARPTLAKTLHCCLQDSSNLETDVTSDWRDFRAKKCCAPSGSSCSALPPSVSLRCTLRRHSCTVARHHHCCSSAKTILPISCSRASSVLQQWPVHQGCRWRRRSRRSPILAASGRPAR